MNKALVFSIVCMLALTFLSIITGNNFISISIAESYSFISLNGTITTFDTTGSMNLGQLQDAILWISVVGGIAVASGIAILGSGLNEKATHWLVYLTFFASLWTILSILAFPLIIEITFFGSLIYIGITLAYAIGGIMFIGGTS